MWRICWRTPSTPLNVTGERSGDACGRRLCLNIGEAFVERLEGWWVNLVVQHLQNPSPPPIPLDLVRQQVHEIRMQFRRERLPDDLFREPVPADQTEPSDDRTFVRAVEPARPLPPRNACG